MTNGPKPKPKPKPKQQELDDLKRELDDSEKQIRAVLVDLKARQDEQFLTDDDDGAAETQTQINVAQGIYNDILNANIDKIETSDLAKEVKADFKAVNAEVQQARDDIKDLAKKLNKIAKALKLLIKVVAKVV